MIPVIPPAMPANFEAEVGQPGNAWVAANPSSTRRPPALWQACSAALAQGFGKRCAYAAMLDPTGGTVDHYYSWINYPYLAYDWENYRFASAAFNSSKKDVDDAVLDPFDVKAGWFEILLPSLQLIVTDAVPEKYRAKADYTLARLKLGHGARAVKWRQTWYQMYQDDKLPLETLREVAPLIAAAIDKQLLLATSAGR
jgi:hypothetical protein